MPSKAVPTMKCLFMAFNFNCDSHFGIGFIIVYRFKCSFFFPFSSSQERQKLWNPAKGIWQKRLRYASFAENNWAITIICAYIWKPIRICSMRALRATMYLDLATPFANTFRTDILRPWATAVHPQHLRRNSSNNNSNRNPSNSSSSTCSLDRVF